MFHNQFCALLTNITQGYIILSDADKIRDFQEATDKTYRLARQLKLMHNCANVQLNSQFRLNPNPGSLTCFSAILKKRRIIKLIKIIEPEKQLHTQFMKWNVSVTVYFTTVSMLPLVWHLLKSKLWHHFTRVCEIKRYRREKCPSSISQFRLSWKTNGLCIMLGSNNEQEFRWRLCRDCKVYFFWLFYWLCSK